MARTFATLIALLVLSCKAENTYAPEGHSGQWGSACPEDWDDTAAQTLHACTGTRRCLIHKGDHVTCMGDWTLTCNGASWDSQFQACAPAQQPHVADAAPAVSPGMMDADTGAQDATNSDGGN